MLRERGARLFDASGSEGVITILWRERDIKMFIYTLYHVYFNTY